MPAKRTIGTIFSHDDTRRLGHLENARVAAVLTKPWVLPPANQNPNDTLPKNYQSVGSRGVSILAGRLLMAIYPPESPFFVLIPAPHLLFNTKEDQQQLELFQQQLFLYVKMLLSELESTTVSLDADVRRWQRGFRAEQMASFEQALICGDTLERMHDNYRMQLFRLDQYVTKRDSTSSVIYHITKEETDMAALTPEQFEKTGLPKDILEDQMNIDKRFQDLFTWVRWQYDTKKWLILQEVNGNVIVESEEPISPYFSTAFEYTGGDYGRGFVEQNLGDLRSLDELELRRLEMMGLASKMLFAKDTSSLIRTEDLAKEPGDVVEGGRVVNGILQDLAPIGFTNPRDYQILSAGVQDKRSDLSKAMLIESETTRRAERVTTVEIQRNIAEISAVLGGIYTALADEKQIPLAARLIHQFNLKNKMSLTDQSGLPTAEIRSLTGLTALANEADGQKLLTALQILQSLGPEAVNRLDMTVAVNVLLRQVGIHYPGLIKSAKQLEAEQLQADTRELANAAGQQAIATSGRVAEQQAAAPPPRQAA